MLTSGGGGSSLVHKLAAALLPEPTTGSRLLAEEFGIKYDEGVEEIDGLRLGLRTVRLTGTAVQRPMAGQVTGTESPSTVCPIASAKCQRGRTVTVTAVLRGTVMDGGRRSKGSPVVLKGCCDVSSSNWT
jgi:hypothetical protein